MDVLSSVARAYAELKTLSVEIVSVTESGDGGNSSRSTQRAKAWFEAPDKVRIEQGGRQGMALATDGVLRHYFYAHQGFPKRYSKGPANPRRHLPGLFRPDLATLGGQPPTFLFSRIAEKVASAEILTEGPESFLVSATYAEPTNPLRRLSSPVQYSVDSRTRLVSRIEGEVSTRMPVRDVARVSKHTVSFESMIVDEPISPEVFTFVPPADALDVSGSGGGIGGGGGGSFPGPGGIGRFESHHQHEWVGETLVERYKLRVHGIDLSFERRLTFSEDRRELMVSERITGPRGETTRDLTLPLG